MIEKELLSFENATHELFSKDFILILIHANPDGDCIGSASALYLLLKKLGKRVKIASPSIVPKRLKFITEQIPPEDIFEGKLSLENSKFKYSAVVSVDVASDELLGDMSFLSENKIDLAFDHHEKNTLSAKKIYILPDASSTGEIIYSIMMYAEKKYMYRFSDKNMVSCIYAAISSDTGCFKYTNTTSKTHMIAAALLDTGAKSGEINYKLFEIKTAVQFSVEKKAMENTAFFLDGKLAICYIADKELEEMGAVGSDTETVVQMIRQIEGVEIAAFIKEKDDTSYKISVRSNEYVDVCSLCAVFGGGGHKKASGCTIPGKFSEVMRKFKIEAEKALQK